MKIYFGETLRFAKSYLTYRSRSISLIFYHYWRQKMKVQAYIHSLKDQEHDRHVLGEAEIIRQIGDNLDLAEVNEGRCTACLL